MREIIRIAALTGALLLTGVATAAEMPTTDGGVPCVPLELAIERLEAAGLEILAEGNARFTGNNLLFVRDKTTVLVMVVVDSCVIPDPLIIGVFKPEYGI